MVGRSRLFDSDSVLINRFLSESDASGNLNAFGVWCVGWLLFGDLSPVFSFVFCSCLFRLCCLLRVCCVFYEAFYLDLLRLVFGRLFLLLLLGNLCCAMPSFLASGVVLFLPGLRSSYCWDIEAWVCVWFLAHMYTPYLVGGVVVFGVGRFVPLVLCWCCSSFVQLGGIYGVVP
ncbi:hypothetical protein MtrunA17_Chr3g0131761 [Medicago truncatula]|uniref:Transmembrane protein n=1 Tax=Medicago truncatula TaxID=3880 RepID=A0A396IWK9_MEDTR|nr:hypothetical protein MtrunA17_Chr3g0131761 [Medicago truncatula]